MKVKQMEDTLKYIIDHQSDGISDELLKQLINRAVDCYGPTRTVGDAIDANNVQSAIISAHDKLSNMAVSLFYESGVVLVSPRTERLLRISIRDLPKPNHPIFDESGNKLSFCGRHILTAQQMADNCVIITYSANISTMSIIDEDGVHVRADYFRQADVSVYDGRGSHLLNVV